MNQGGMRMNRGNGVILTLVMAVITACASAGGGEGDGMAGPRPSDNAMTRSAGVHLARATTTQGDEAVMHYQAALDDALDAIEQEPMNARGYLLAGQAAVGVGEWVRADTMFSRAVDIYPGYEAQIASEREQGWINAYNEGVELVQAGDVPGALESFEAADLLYQARPEARMNIGWAHMQLGNTTAAIDAYQGALDILRGPVMAGVDEEQLAAWRQDEQTTTFNLAQLHAAAGQFEEAARVIVEFEEARPDIDPETRLMALTAKAQYLAQAGREEEAEALYAELLEREGLTSLDYFQIGVGFFNTEDYVRAAEAFRQSAEMNPYSRDAHLNLVQSLYSEAIELEQEDESAERDARLAEIYAGILESAEQVQRFDPLNRNLLSFVLRAYRGQGILAEEGESEAIQRRIQQVFSEYEDLDWEVRDVGLNVSPDGETAMTGELVNVSGEPGSPVRLRFDILGEGGSVIATETVTVSAPEVNTATAFQARIDTRANVVAGWRYELVQ